MANKYIKIWSTDGMDDINILRACQDVLRNPRKHKHTIFDFGTNSGEKISVIVQQEKNGVSGRLFKEATGGSR